MGCRERLGGVWWLGVGAPVRVKIVESILVIIGAYRQNFSPVAFKLGGWVKDAKSFENYF